MTEIFSGDGYKHFKIPPFKLSKDKNGRMRTKIAICGFAGTTRHLAPYDDDEWEIFGLNEAHRQPWMKRITRWFQIHKKWDFTKQSQPAYKVHWEWLQRPQPVPIYMQEKYPDVPSAVKFPLDEIIEMFLPNVKRGEDVNKYFTSSYSFMLALALYMAAKSDIPFSELTVGTWGFEMATDTEYRYQKGSTEYWMGIATGLGVHMYIPPECRLIRGAIYGWEVSRMINRQRLEFLKRQSIMVQDALEKELMRINGKRDETEKLLRGATKEALKQTYAIRQQELLQHEVVAFGRAQRMQGRVDAFGFLIQVVDNMHAGRDPGDGFTGPEGDLDPAAEAAVQEAAEKKAQAEAAEAIVPDIGPSE